MTDLLTTQPNLSLFRFDQHLVRVFVENGEPWFSAADVCGVLRLSRTAPRRLDEDEKGVRSTHTPGGRQRLTVVNEPGLYTLIMASRKPEARRFRRWVTHEVLPSIRHAGSYVVPRVTATPGEPEWRRQVRTLAQQYFDDFHAGVEGAALGPPSDEVLAGIALDMLRGQQLVLTLGDDGRFVLAPQPRGRQCVNVRDPVSRKDFVASLAAAGTLPLLVQEILGRMTVDA